MKKTYSTFMISMVFMLFTLSGCLNDADKIGVGERTSKLQSADKPVVISTAWGMDPHLSFKNGESISDNVTIRWAKEKLGIEIKTLWSTTDINGAFATKLRLALSSGDEMPDILSIGDEQTAQELIDSGKFTDVGSLFDQYASQLWKDAMNQDPNVWNAYSRGGRRMGIPILDYAYNNDYLLWIRQDWLDQLKLTAPKTLDELEKVMEAFKNQNPNGLAPKDVIPLSMGFKNSMNSWMGDPSWVFGAFDTIPQQWNEVSFGELAYGSVQPGMKQGLMILKHWMDKGYISREAALWDENKTAEPAIYGQAGIIAGPYWMSGWPLEDTKKNVTGAVWKPYPLPTGPNGHAGRHGTKISNGVILISKTMEHPEAFFTYENYLFAHLANPQPGDEWQYGLFKGYDYDTINGKKVYGDDIPDGGAVNVRRYFLVRDGARIPDVQIKALQHLAEGAEAQTMNEILVKNNFGPETPAASVVLMQQKDIAMMNMFTGVPTPTIKSTGDYLRNIESQTFNEIIYGKKGPEAFDEFVRVWKISGGDQITKEVNDWYRSMHTK
jgi:putative aldouronate transport system substrate-binding protein